MDFSTLSKVTLTLNPIETILNASPRFTIILQDSFSVSSQKFLCISVSDSNFWLAFQFADFITYLQHTTLGLPCPVCELSMDYDSFIMLIHSLHFWKDVVLAFKGIQ